MTSQGMEHVYLQQWLVNKLGTDPFILAGPTGDQVMEAPELAAALPSIVFRIGENWDTTIRAGPHREQVRIPMGIEVQMEGMDIEPLLPIANRIDHILASREVRGTWTAPDGSLVNITAITRDRGYSGTLLINDDEPVRVVGGDWTFAMEVQLPAGYFDL